MVLSDKICTASPYSCVGPQTEEVWGGTNSFSSLFLQILPTEEAFSSPTDSRHLSAGPRLPKLRSGQTGWRPEQLTICTEARQLGAGRDWISVKILSQLWLSVRLSGVVRCARRDKRTADRQLQLRHTQLSPLLFPHQQFM